MSELELNKYVTPDGSLDGRLLWKREPLYRGMNGRCVERFYPSPEQSYIFKPLTNGESVDREAWIYRHVLSLFPPIFPKLLAVSMEGAGEAGWSIFEDLGPLRHDFDLELAKDVVERMAWWHAFPVSHWRGLTGHGVKPPIEQIAADVLKRWDEAGALLNDIEEYSGFGQREMNALIRGLANADGQSLSGIRVLSHGDLHLGNYARGADGRLYILDWEHAHMNTPYWDLYHLIDISHPMFPKKITIPEREMLLDYYLRQSARQGCEWEREAFIRGYFRFSAAFSLWMLLLIAGDLERGDSVWPKDRLLKQREETRDHLIGCLSRISSGLTGNFTQKD
ncbi:phosphotransferase [Paenibacillus haidiansis]